MKRIGKILLAVLLMLALCLCLCSCAELDELKASRAELRKDENGESIIVFRDSIYRSAASLLKSEATLQISFSGTAYLADPDVPVLLLDNFGVACPYNEDASVIYYPEAYSDRYDSIKDHHNDEYFVREDKLDDLRTLLEGGSLSRYCITDRDETYTMVYPMIAAEYTELLSKLTALADASTEYLPELPEAADYAFSRAMYRCDEDVSFRIGDYYIVRQSADGSGTVPVKETYIYNGNLDRCARIPEEYLSATDHMIDSLKLFDPLPWEW